MYKLEANTTRYNIELGRGEIDRERLMKVYLAEVEENEYEVQRYLEYLSVVRAGDASEFAVRVANICGRYLDEKTISFLETVRQLYGDASQAVVDGDLRELKLKVRGADARDWTG